MKISVALCTYNGEKFLKEQIDSILNQTQKVDEIVVCDDGSTDCTIEILKEYDRKYPNIFHIYRNKVNLRSVKNFEKAISLCSGDVIFLSDQDDIWVSHKVEKYVAYFNANPHITVLASNGYCIDENSKVHDKYSIWDVPQFLREAKAPLNYYHIITQISNIATGSTMAFKKEIVAKAIPFPVSEGFHHDEWLALISSKNKNFEFLNEKFYFYRIHSNQQVGGVFFDKREKIKNKYVQIFDLNNAKYSFSAVKSKIKRLILAYTKNEMLANTDTIHTTYFIENLELIQLEIKKMKHIFQQQHPLRYYILVVSDKILKKRQLPF